MASIVLVPNDWGLHACYMHMSLVDSSMEPAALLACINPPLLPLLHAGQL
jgi:hypothetical protein